MEKPFTTESQEEGSKFKVQGSRFKAQSSRFKVQGSRFKARLGGEKLTLNFEL
jgi:hypothetical protein